MQSGSTKPDGGTREAAMEGRVAIGGDGQMASREEPRSCSSSVMPPSSITEEAGGRDAATVTMGPVGDDGAAASTEAGTSELQRLHMLPFAEAEARLAGRNRMDFLAPELRRLRREAQRFQTGDVISHENVEFAIIKCEPAQGPLGMDTDYYADGSPVVFFEKIQFSAWGPNAMGQNDLFMDVIVPYFKGDYGPYGAKGSKRVRFFYASQVFQIGEVQLRVEATEPVGLGVVTCQTDIFANWDITPEFDKVHIVPFQDTLPRAYEYDIFQDYVKPYLQAHLYKKFQFNELFSYHGVQFKLVACEPDAPGRIGKGTTIFCEGVLHPSLRNLLTPELLTQVSQLPTGLQMLLLNTERTTRELEEMLTQRRGLFEETLAEIETFTWPPPDVTATSQTTCMICLGEFNLVDNCRRLPCRHIFHSSCVLEWLRRCTDCPICKDNVDRAIRRY